MFDKLKESKWFPDRKVLAGGVAGVLGFVIATALGEMDAETSAAIGAGLWALISYFVPESKKDLLKKADKTLEALAEKMSQEAVKDEHEDSAV